MDRGGVAEIRGFPAAKGIVAEWHRKRVITTVADIHLVQPGDILGLRRHDYGVRTPVFGIIAACVCDTGGSLTHAAIVSREYGIHVRRRHGGGDPGDQDRRPGAGGRPSLSTVRVLASGQ